MNSFIKLDPKKVRINKLLSQFNRNNFYINDNSAKTFYINKKTINNNYLLNSNSHSNILKRSKKLSLTNNKSQSFSTIKLSTFNNEKEKFDFCRKNPGFLYYKEILDNIKLNKLNNIFIKQETINKEMQKENSFNNSIFKLKKINKNKLYNFRYSSKLLRNNNYIKKIDFANKIKLINSKNKKNKSIVIHKSELFPQIITSYQDHNIKFKKLFDNNYKDNEKEKNNDDINDSIFYKNQKNFFKTRKDIKEEPENAEEDNYEEVNWNINV